MIVTDLDDTLYKEKDYVRSSVRAIGESLERMGVMSVSEVVDILNSAATLHQGFSLLSSMIKAIYPHTEFDDKWMVNIYRTHEPRIELNETVIDLFMCLIKNGQTIAIITDGRSNTQRAKIKALGLDQFVSPWNIIISSEVGGDKTTRVPFDTLMSRNPNEKQFVYIGDNPAKDFYWPNELGWETIQLDDTAGINIHSQTIEVPDNFKAKYRISRIEDIVNYL
ncbi:MAG: HAD hydrolase-like protein [Bacteroidales bacterium]|nr:HAD hydrolase-like protein [Bacteroidales bacterium]